MFINNRGSSLTEVLTVISLTAVLGSIALPLVGNYICSAKEAVLNYNLKIMEQSLEIYKIFKGNYPDELSLLVEEGYFREIPTDPFTGENNYFYNQEKGKIVSLYKTKLWGESN